MKKFFILLFAVTVSLIIACSGGSNKKDNTNDTLNKKDTVNADSASVKGKYTLKSGIITMKIETMGMKQDMTVYFDDYGTRECTETVYAMDMGMAGKIETHNMTITRDGYIYNLDLVNKTGTKTKLIYNKKGKTDNIDFNHISPDNMKELNITKEGTEQVLDKTCDKYSMSCPDLNIKATYYIWNGFSLKWETNMMGIVTKYTSTKIEENATVPAEKFEIPKDITPYEIK